MNISEKIKEMQGDFGKYHVTENNEEECKLENMIMLILNDHGHFYKAFFRFWSSCFIKDKGLSFLSA